MSEEEARAINGVDSAQTEVSEVIAFIDLMQGVYIHLLIKFFDKLLPPVPSDERRNQCVIVSEFQIQWCAQ